MREIFSVFREFTSDIASTVDTFELSSSSHSQNTHTHAQRTVIRTHSLCHWENHDEITRIHTNSSQRK